MFSPFCSTPFLCSSPLFLSASAPTFLLFSVSSFFFLSASAPHLSSFFCFSLFLLAPLPFLLLFSAHLFFFLAPHSLFSLDVLPFIFQPKIPFFSAQNVFASAQNLFQSKTFFTQKSLLVCGSTPPSFLPFQRLFSFF